MYRSSKLIGRDAELRAVLDSLESAQAGLGGAVFLVGESGVGKSRLTSRVAELATVAGMRVMRGRGSTIGTAVPLRPLTEALLSLLRAGPVDPTALGPYGPILGRLVPDWGRPPADQENASLVILAEAVLRLTGVAGAGRGCLMLLDDLQDADTETLAVLEYLIDNVALQPTMLLGAIRAESCAALALARSAAQRGQCTLIELGRLDDDGLRQMIGACLGAAPERVPAAVHALVSTGSSGNPFLIEELVAGMIDGALLVGGPEGWRMSEKLPAALPSTLARGMVQGVEQLDPQTRELLSMGALLGERFPLTVVQAATGLSDRAVLDHLGGDVAGRLVTVDDQLTDWYAFRHRVTREALLTLLGPGERPRLARRMTDAVEKVFPGLPGEWCQVAATLHLEADNPEAAGRLFTEAGRRAIAQGGATTAVALLDRAIGLLGENNPVARAAALEALLHALAEAGLVERALASVSILDQIGGVDPRRRAQLHTRLAWAATVAGRSAEGLAQVEQARALLGPDAAAEDTAPVDVIAAHLVLDTAGHDQLATAEALARRAATVAETVPLPVVACQAWQLLGALIRHRDPTEATRCLERALVIAAQHRLPIWEIHALIRLGNDDALRDASLDRLEQARERASQAGAVTARHQAEASLALHAALRGDFDTANSLVQQVLAATTRLKLLETTQYVLMVSAVLAGHQARRREMEHALAEFRRWSGDLALHAPRVHGLARAFCALLEEDRPRALDELARAFSAEERSPTVFHLSGRHGLHLLLQVMSGEAGWPAYEAVQGDSASRLRWDLQFALFAKAVLLGRSGRPDAAQEAAAEAIRAGEPYAMGRHLALRLVGESALADGWGHPVQWLRAAEEHFHRGDVPAVASACRALLRQAGVRVNQRRSGAGDIPAGLRSAGVTVREFEVLRLLVGRLSNREIAGRLHLSPRTVERHVSSLLGKTGLPNRIALSEFAAEVERG
ncbi:AAA family ATPase [Micromonospora peucetia]|uniref:ATP-binding protein n=1 Tax=Micromonospora peucetia TaxID=47871 RepID=UPI002257CF1B|nr:LuxR family transcriptional regulator [Micromonospora peucetia]MCX4387899.1 AAA family ATPase [Micromonospora peucetia]